MVIILLLTKLTIVFVLDIFPLKYKKDFVYECIIINHCWIILEKLGEMVQDELFRKEKNNKN